MKEGVSLIRGNQLEEIPPPPPCGMVHRSTTGTAAIWRLEGKQAAAKGKASGAASQISNPLPARKADRIQGWVGWAYAS